MIVLKILAAPVMVALSLLAAMVTFLFCVASAVCELGCIVLTLLFPYPVHRRTGGGRDRIPRPCVSRFALWRSHYRGVAGGQAALGQVRPAGFHHRLILRDKMSQSRNNGG